MDYTQLKDLIAGSPDLAIRYIRQSDINVRISAFEAFCLLASNHPARVDNIIADFGEVLRMEVIPVLVAETEPIYLQALAQISYGIGFLVSKMPNPSRLISLLPTLFDLLSHPYPRVKIGAVSGLGYFIGALPEEFDDSRINLLLRILADDDPEVRASAAFAWGNIALGGSKKATEAIGKIYGLLTDSHEMVRGEACGFFNSLATYYPAECAVALPLLRELRDSDPNIIVKERAAASVQAITA